MCLCLPMPLQLTLSLVVLVDRGAIPQSLLMCHMPTSASIHEAIVWQRILARFVVRHVRLCMHEAFARLWAWVLHLLHPHPRLIGCNQVASIPCSTATSAVAKSNTLQHSTVPLDRQLGALLLLLLVVVV